MKEGPQFGLTFNSGPTNAGLLLKTKTKDRDNKGRGKQRRQGDDIRLYHSGFDVWDITMTDILIMK